MKKQALSITEAAEMLGVSRPTLYKMIKEGKIPALRLRRRIVIPIDEFNEWVRIESRGAVKATIYPNYPRSRRRIGDPPALPLLLTGGLRIQVELTFEKYVGV